MNRFLRLAASLSCTLVLWVPAATAEQNPTTACREAGRNIQCNDLGSIGMDNQREIRGDPIRVQADVWIEANMAERGARWMLFSMRSLTGENPEPVSLSLVRLATPNGEIITTRVDRPNPQTIELWVDILDVPVQVPIAFEVEMGVTQRGAFRLEALVLPFDRGYSTLPDGAGGDTSLFAATLVGVNEETTRLEGAGSGSLLDGRKTPALALPASLALLGLAVALRRRT